MPSLDGTQVCKSPYYNIELLPIPLIANAVLYWLNWNCQIWGIEKSKKIFKWHYWSTKTSIKLLERKLQNRNDLWKSRRQSFSLERGFLQQTDKSCDTVYMFYLFQNVKLKSSNKSSKSLKPVSIIFISILLLSC